MRHSEGARHRYLWFLECGNSICIEIMAGGSAAVDLALRQYVETDSRYGVQQRPIYSSAAVVAINCLSRLTWKHTRTVSHDLRAHEVKRREAYPAPDAHWLAYNQLT